MYTMYSALFPTASPNKTGVHLLSKLIKLAELGYGGPGDLDFFFFPRRFFFFFSGENATTTTTITPHLQFTIDPFGNSRGQSDEKKETNMASFTSSSLTCWAIYERLIYV